MLISVIIPTCHRNDLLARCLDALAPGQQSLAADQYEVIVTDDGSCSTSEAMIRERYGWVRWTAGPCRGPAANRNHGVKLATGEWIAFTDDDCVPSSGWLEAFLNTRSKDVYVYEGKTTCNAGLRGFSEESPVNLTGGVLCSCNFMISLHLFYIMSGFDECFPHATMEDIDFRERLRRDGHKFAFVSNACVDHPPRPRTAKFRAGKHWESRVYFAKKWGWTRVENPWLPLFVFKYRLSELISVYPLRDYPIALWSMGCELGYVFLHYGRWKRQYRELDDRTEACNRQNARPG